MTTIWENFRDKVDTLVAEYIKELEEKNQTLKDKIEFLTQCLDNRDKSIELMKHKNELQLKAIIKLCLKHHYDSIIIAWEEVIDMSNYKVVEKKKPQEEKLF